MFIAVESPGFRTPKVIVFKTLKQVIKHYNLTIGDGYSITTDEKHECELVDVYEPENGVAESAAFTISFNYDGTVTADDLIDYIEENR